MKFTKKPVTIEATQWFEDGDHPAVVMKTGPGRYADDGVPWIETLEGGHIVTPGDWIITGVKGEHYPCKQDIFELTYDKAAPQPAAPVQPAHEQRHDLLYSTVKMQERHDAFVARTVQGLEEMMQAHQQQKSCATCKHDIRHFGCDRACLDSDSWEPK